jgi:hypothetical protein
MDQTRLNQVGNFDQTTINQLAADTGSLVEAISVAGALSLGIYASELTIGSTLAFTLAAPTFAGQKKLIRCVAVSGTPLGTVTITSPDTVTGFVCSSTFTFTDVGQAIWLEATAGLKWRATRVQRAGGAANNVVVGTTVLTGLNLWLRYCLSVTGTVNSTGTSALPNGSAIGERIIITNSTAALTPIGSIDGVYTGMINEAYTHLGAIGVVASSTVEGDTAILEWTGTSWSVLTQNGCTLS